MSIYKVRQLIETRNRSVEVWKVHVMFDTHLLTCVSIQMMYTMEYTKKLVSFGYGSLISVVEITIKNIPGPVNKYKYIIYLQYCNIKYIMHIKYCNSKEAMMSSQVLLDGREANYDWPSIKKKKKIVACTISQIVLIFKLNQGLIPFKYVIRKL